MSKQREEIEIVNVDHDTFTVTITELGTSSEHTVKLDDEYYQKLTQGHITKMELIRLSIRFLLKKEPKEMILPEFNLTIIPRYFLDYEEYITV